MSYVEEAASRATVYDLHTGGIPVTGSSSKWLLECEHQFLVKGPRVSGQEGSRDAVCSTQGMPQLPMEAVMIPVWVAGQVCSKQRGVSQGEATLMFSAKSFFCQDPVQGWTTQLGDGGGLSVPHPFLWEQRQVALVVCIAILSLLHITTFLYTHFSHSSPSLEHLLGSSHTPKKQQLCQVRVSFPVWLITIPITLTFSLCTWLCVFP